jgi:ABC-type cobalamin/Fe3+-siderophores transport system ATPase subunit
MGVPNPVRVADLTFNDGSTISTVDSDIVVLLGPNNAGKSRTLQEIHLSLSLEAGQVRPPNSFFVLDALSLRRDLDADG